MPTALHAIPDHAIIDGHDRMTATMRHGKPAWYRRVPGWVLVLIVGLLLATGTWFVAQGAGTSEDKANQSARSADAIAADVLAVCQRGPLLTPDGRDICPSAAAVKADPVIQQDAAAAVGLSTDQVVALVRAELAAHPPADGRTPTAGELDAAVRRVLEANPDLYRGQPGPGPTDAQLRAAAQAVVAADPDAFRGPRGPEGQDGGMGENGRDGLDGKDGRDGIDGKDGEPGRGIASTAADPDDPCTRVVTFTDGTTEDWQVCPPVDEGEEEPTPMGLFSIGS